MVPMIGAGFLHPATVGQVQRPGRPKPRRRRALCRDNFISDRREVFERHAGDVAGICNLPG
jgi:hypothetical protein